MCVCRHVFLHVWVLPAHITEWICVTSCFTVLGWLPFLSLQRPGLHVVTWLILETEGPLPKHCLCPCNTFQVPCMAPGIPDFACALAGVAPLPLLEICAVESRCVYLLPSSAASMSAVIFSSSHSWSMEIPMWSDSSPGLLALNSSGVCKVSLPKVRFYHFIICSHLCSSLFSCDHDTISRVSLSAKENGACTLCFGDNLEEGGQTKGIAASKTLYYSALLV